ncbi:MAG: class I SAM-dependent methyltransferase [Akkermansiaceae bacterium]
MRFLPLISALALMSAIFFLWKSGSQNPVSKNPGILQNSESDPSRSAPENLTDKYDFGKATRDGTGKFYLNREIAKVMGHPAISWLERSNREDEEAPSKALAMLGLKEDAVIADIGAGSGYYTFRLAKQLPKGQVIAVDIQPEMISYLEQEKESQKVGNVSAHLGKIDDTLLPQNSIDAAIMVDAYHEFSHPYEMILSIRRALRPGGRIFLLEYRAEDPLVRIKPLHKMTEAQAIAEMKEAGMRWVATKDDLPWQHFMVFEKTE